MQLFAIIIALLGAGSFEGMALLYQRRIIPAGPLIALATSVFLTMVGLTIIGLASPASVIAGSPAAAHD